MDIDEDTVCVIIFFFNLGFDFSALPTGVPKNKHRMAMLCYNPKIKYDSNITRIVVNTNFHPNDFTKVLGFSPKTICYIWGTNFEKLS